MIVSGFKSWVAGACALLAFASCGGHYRIDGVVDAFGYEGRRLSLVEFHPEGSIVYDSCVVSRGRFQMKGHTDSVRLMFLCKGNERNVVIPIYLERGRSKIEIHPTDINVSGSRQNNLFFNFFKRKIEIDNRYEDLYQRKMSLSRSGLNSERIQSLQDSLCMTVNECEDMIVSFMKENYREPAAVGIFMMLSTQDSNEIPTLLRRILDAAPKEFLAKSPIKHYTERMGYTRQ